jgi:hypothetical protein
MTKKLVCDEDRFRSGDAQGGAALLWGEPPHEA